MSEIIIKGIYRDVFRDESERVVFDSGWKNNLIVQTCRVLLAGFMKSEGETSGIQSLKVGRGDPNWDNNPLLPDASISTLVDESPYTIARDQLTLRYLDAGGQASTMPTNRLEVISTLGQNQPPAGAATTYPLREFGLFGVLKGQEYMIDYIRHPLIEKDKTVTLERRIQLFF